MAEDGAATALEATPLVVDADGAVVAAALTRQRNALKPGLIQREIEGFCNQIERLALAKAPASYRPVNRAFNSRLEAEVFSKATNQASQRICHEVTGFVNPYITDGATSASGGQSAESGPSSLTKLEHKYHHGRWSETRAADSTPKVRISLDPLWQPTAA